jgi:aminoglycoside 3-N-acetyltransferase I
VSLRICQLTTNDIGLMQSLLLTFGEAFNETDTYGGNQPPEEYLRQLLGGDSFIAVAAIASGASEAIASGASEAIENKTVVGGIAAYELKKFEQQRSEIYIYDLAVAETHRRRGIATALINELKKIAVARGAYVIYVQADIVDEPAIALYTKLGIREDVLHFDIAVSDSSS